MRQRTRIGLHRLIFFFMTVVALAPSIIILPMLATLSRDITRSQAVGVLQAAADGMAGELARDLQERWDVVRALGVFAAEPHDPNELRLRFETLVRTTPLFAWLGLATTAGVVTVASDRVLEGANVAAHPWFKAGLNEPYAGDMHNSVMLQAFLAPTSKEPLRLLDFSLPIKRPDGVPFGVLGAQIRWQGVRTLIQSLSHQNGMEFLLLARDGTVLAGPERMEGKKLALGVVRAAEQGVARSGVEQWPDGQEYLAVAVPMINQKDVPSFGWSLLVRQPAKLALLDTYAAAARLLPVIIGGAAFILVATWGFGYWVAGPIRRLASAAEAIVAGRSDTPVPDERAFAEVASLADSLARVESRLSEVKPT